MQLPWWLFWPHQSYWSEYSLKGIQINVSSPKKDAFPGSPVRIPPYFWDSGLRNWFGKLIGRKPAQSPFPIHPGYAEVRDLIGNGTVADLERLSVQARGFVAELFRDIEDVFETSSIDEVRSLSSPESGPTLVQLRLSSDLERWKESQHAVGNILPPKGAGLSQASDKVLRFFGAAGWPEALKTNNALFGCGLTDLLVGAADAPTVFSNYVTDMAFYWEHGYNHIFPSLESLLQKGLADPHALATLGGRERRNAVGVGKQYIQAKIALEKQHKTQLTNRSARLSRRTAQIIFLSESSLLGLAAEATIRGFDPGLVMSDLVFSSPGTDVVDVGSDLVNSEVVNSFLNVADITDTGIVSEDVLRRVYDAYAATGARMLTQRWHEPAAKMCSLLYTWHIQNDRHMFFRRAILGWPKARKKPALPQCEADFDEVFDKQYRTTNVRRPLDPEFACNGEDLCDHVRHVLGHSQQEPLLGELWSVLVMAPLEYVRRGQIDEGREHELAEALLGELWSVLVMAPLEYVRRGQIDEGREHELAEGSRLRMAELYSRGLVLEMVWLMAHANHHAWQVNYLFEAAMFGSILDGGTLAGKLDRQEES